MKKILQKTSKVLSFILLASSVIWLGGCGEEDDPIVDNILEILEGNTTLSKITAELKAVGLDATISSDTETYTLFAPSDQALTDLLSTLGLEDFSPVRTDVAQAVLAYHIHVSKLLEKDITSGSTISTLQGENISVDGSLLVSGSSTPASIESSIEATNGIVHIIDKALIPPTIGALIFELLGTVGQPIFLGADFSTLADAILKADVFATGAAQTTIRSILVNLELDLTVFAPVNAVFTAGGLTVASLTGEQWYGLILNHIVNDIYGAGGTAFAPGQEIGTYAQLSLVILAIDAPLGSYGSGVVIDSNGDATPEAQIALEDAGFGGNGTVHALAGILDPS